MSKKIKIIVMILLVVIVAITISIIIHNNNDNKDNNDNNEYIQLKDLDEIVSVTEYEGETYYLLKTNSNFVEYKVSMRSSSIEGNSDMKKLMSYSEYSNFCKENHFNQYYGDKNKNYIVYACEAKHSYINGITLQGITIENGEATLYVYENTEGDETKHP